MQSKSFCLFTVDIIYIQEVIFPLIVKKKPLTFCKYCTYILENTSIDGKSINKDHGSMAYSMKTETPANST